MSRYDAWHWTVSPTPGRSVKALQMLAPEGTTTQAHNTLQGPERVCCWTLGGWYSCYATIPCPTHRLWVRLQTHVPAKVRHPSQKRFVPPWRHSMGWRTMPMTSLC